MSEPFIVTMPCSPPSSMSEESWRSFLSRIDACTALVDVMISAQSERPVRSLHGTSCWVITTFRFAASRSRTCCCSIASNALIRRETDSAAPDVCSVANVRCPVSASVSAASMDVRSRISPNSTMSGSSRRTARRALWKLSVSCPTSRCETRHFAETCRYSTGSSMVKRCSSRVLLMRSRMLASVVVLPLPVAPVTRTSPCFIAQISSRSGIGSPSSSKAKNRFGRRRMAHAMRSSFKYTLMRMRRSPTVVSAPSNSRDVRNAVKLSRPISRSVRSAKV